MMKCSVYVAASVNGFIARKDGGIDWLVSYNDESGEQYGFKSFFDSVDYLVMGRNTFDLVSTFPEWPYGNKHVIVLSSKYPSELIRINEHCEGISSPPAKIISILESRGAQHLYIDGGKTIQSFLAEGFINEITVTIIPVLLGEGIPLFGRMVKDLLLQHLESKIFPDGLVQSKYKVLS